MASWYGVGDYGVGDYSSATVIPFATLNGSGTASGAAYTVPLPTFYSPPAAGSFPGDVRAQVQALARFLEAPGHYAGHVGWSFALGSFLSGSGAYAGRAAVAYTWSNLTAPGREPLPPWEGQDAPGGAWNGAPAPSGAWSPSPAPGGGWSPAPAPGGGWSAAPAPDDDWDPVPGVPAPWESQDPAEAAWIEVERE